MSKTHWKKLVNKDYLGVYSLPVDENGNVLDMNVNILSVSLENVTGIGGRTESLPVAKINGNKPLILNKTNMKMIEKLSGTPFVENWQGMEITLYKDKTKFGRETVDCLRIRPTNLQQQGELLTKERFEVAIKQVKDGRFDINHLLNKSRFNLTVEQRATAEKLKGDSNV